MRIAVVFSELSRAFVPKLSEQVRSLAVGFGEYYGAESEVPAYSGRYTITPDASNEQTLSTAQKKLTDDIVVEKIPYFEVSNNSGGKTVTIA